MAHLAMGQHAIKKPLKNELRVTSVNDNYAPPFRDRYFTNGLSITYSRATEGTFLEKITKSEETAKSIIRIGISHEIYTPENISETNPLSNDRPYAGYLFTNITVNTFWESKNSLRLALHTGIIGPLAAGGSVQAWWHKLINQEQPQGWESQIGNEPVINFGLTYGRSWTLSQKFDVISTAGAETGTGFNNLYAGVTVRAGEIRPMDRSAITASMPETGTMPDFRKNEWYLLFGIKNTFVIHNTLIEGNLFRPSKNGHTQSAEFYLFDIITGFAYSTNAVTWKATVHRLSPELAGGGNHTFASLEMAVRF
ncbi:lipid A deacylase LpxR family protein [Rhodohalobacter mucosus]|nr:lipid A deacylase LpxR family protein [Rhodohalobacter mucosus]